MTVQFCTRSVLRAGRFANRSAVPRRTVTNSAPARPGTSEKASSGRTTGSAPSRWTGASVLAVAAGAGAAGWAVASFGQGADAPWANLIPGHKKTLLDADRPPRFANVRELEKVRSVTLYIFVDDCRGLEVAGVCRRPN